MCFQDRFLLLLGDTIRKIDNDNNNRKEKVVH